MLKRFPTWPSTYEFETRNMLNVSLCDIAITRLSPMKKFVDNSEMCREQKPEKEDIGDGDSAYFKWGQNCIDTMRQVTSAVKNSK